MKRNSILHLITAREIRNTFGRFFAIFAIIALGTGFFAGLRITTPVMIRSVDRFWRDAQFYDYRILSSYGWKEKEVEAFRAKEEVRAAEGAWQYDVLVENAAGDMAVYKVHSMTEQLNLIRLAEGRLPENASECLMDASNRGGFELGDIITFSPDNETDTLDAFEGNHFTIVGFTDASLYLNFERGTTSIGNGSVAGFIYLPKNAFSNDYYTEIYVKLNEDDEIYSELYTSLLDKGRDKWENTAKEQAEERYDELVTEARDELDDAKQEFEDKKSEGEEELKDAEQELKDGEKELKDAEQELKDAEQELKDGEQELKDAKKELDDGEKELADAKQELEDGEKELKDAKKELDDGKKELDESEQKLADAKSELDKAAKEISDGEKQLKSGKAELDKAKNELESNKVKLDDAKCELDVAKAQLESGKAELDESEKTLNETEAQLDAAKSTLDEKGGELSAAEAQLAQSKAELEAAKSKLDETSAELEAGAAEIAKKEQELEGALAAGLISEEEAAAGREKIAEEKQKLAAGQAAYEEGLSRYEAGKAKYEGGLAQYQNGKAAYDEGLKQYEAGRAAFEAGRTQFENGRTEYENGKAEYEAGLRKYEEGMKQWEAGKDQYEDGLKEWEAASAKLEAGRAEYEAGKAQYEDGLAQFEEGKAKYEDGLAEYEDGVKEFEDGKKEYEDGLKEYEDGKKEYEDGVKEFEDGKKEYEDGKKEYEDGLKEYEDGVKEYEDGKETFDREIADAEVKIADAEQELADLDEPDTWLLERNTNVAYACFESDSQIVQQIAAVFPVFFILVAALVIMTTMSRMVEEQRGQMGILKGLGYSSGEIVQGFLAYAGIASVLGCVVGYAVGVTLFPTVIWHAYQMMYINIPLRYYIDPWLFGGELIAALICSLGSTYFTCRGTLQENAASLMRPKAPKAGKRVLLENVPFVWKRLSFIQKVTVRNIFRYKRRFFMMLLGIGGCTALLLTGFGIKDSIRGFGSAQFDDIQKADAELIFRNGKGDRVPEDLTEAVAKLGADSVSLIRGSYDAVFASKVKSVDVVAFAGQVDGQDESAFFTLRDLKGNELALPGKGEVLVSMSIAERYGAREGSSFVLRDEDMREIPVTVAGVFENYVYNYVIVSPETLREAGSDSDVNGLYVNFPERMDVYEGQAELAACDNTSSVTILADFRDRIADMMEALNYVILLIIASAGGLAFVVLYNLTNINIIERMREIATIKVLGFNERETSDYIFRENLILTAFGAGAGLFLGILLHRFVMSKVVVDLVCFPRKILPLSYVYALVFTFVFTFLVNLFMARKLDRINMAESLKAVE